MTPDFESMQAQAIKYAQEMHKKSKNNNSYFIQTPDNNNAINKYDAEHKQSYNQSIPNHNRSSGIKNIFNAADSKSDNDVLLILVLLLLLTQDGGDKMLMLALMYIMT